MRIRDLCALNVCVSACVLYALRLYLKVVDLYRQYWKCGRGEEMPVKFNYCRVCVCICICCSFLLALCFPLLPPLCLLSRINNCHNWFRQSTQHFAVCCSCQHFVAAATRSLQRCQAALSHFLYLSILLHFCSIKKIAQIFDLFDICKRERHLPSPSLPSLLALWVCQIKVLSKNNNNIIS